MLNMIDYERTIEYSLISGNRECLHGKPNGVVVDDDELRVLAIR